MQLSLTGYRSKNQRIIYHVLFWLIVWLLMTLVYAIGIPGYGLAALIILMFLPIHMFSFYTIAYFATPRYLYKKKYVQFVVFLVLMITVSAVLFRLGEIFFADPIIYRAIKKIKNDFVWHKLDGDFWQQFLNPTYIVNCIEQSNLVVWVALAFKFIKMWFERRQAAMEAELNFLKSQVHPHFLFNTLNNLYSLTLQQSPQSPGVVLGLSEILRYMLYECNSETIALSKDVQILESYIALEKIRYEDRIDITFSITGDLRNNQIAPLLLMPLVENAFKHGASEELEEAWINMDLYVKNNQLKFKISNSLPEQLTEPANTKGKIGLLNLKKRLDILYPQSHGFRVFRADEMFVAILELDLNKRIAV
ncbi:histidine kinase [Pedobacter sp. HMF7647]|uniref:Histidine kinase n=1 Tax=Hufsiella arboris TaxID=2695275 RepID=A0A7K1YFY9_9SPHI|nr:histidine kinase [Hufsiella arboris]MXV52899.1 histidine kinase [Hufsiella arboris]